MPETNQLAPNFELPDLEGRFHQLSDYRGLIVVINFWSAECPQVQRVDRVLEPFLAAWGSDVVLLPIAANANESLEGLRAASIRRSLPIVLHDVEGRVAERYGAVTTPHFFVIDRDGILRYHGAFDNLSFRQRLTTQSYLTDAVQAILIGHPPVPAETQPFGCAIVRL